MQLRFYILLIGLFLGLGYLSAQVAAPDFQCLRNDTLQWSNPSISCGAYVSTHIWVATDINGPYSELVVLTNATQTNYHHPNPTGVIRYYYLFYTYNCPGQAALNSDTLSNLIPSPPASTWVSEENGLFILHWTPSSSPQTSGYLIYRQAAEGFVVVGNVAGATTTSFTDNGLVDYLPGTTYRVTAIDPCGNNSLFGPEVRTAGLALEGGLDCVSEVSVRPIELTAASSPRPFIEQALFVATNGGPFLPAGTFAATMASLPYNDGNDGETVCFYVEASVQGDARRVRTPIQCTDIRIVQPIRNLDLYGAGFTPNGELRFDFNWDNLAATESLVLQLQAANALLTNFELPFASLQGPIATAALASQQQPAGTYSFSLRGTDICDNVVLSNSVAPVFLSGSVASPGTNLLTWTPLQPAPTAINTNYQLNRSNQDGTTSLLYSGTDLTFSDQLGLEDTNLANTCYTVTATVTFTDGTQRSYASQTVCLEQQTPIYFPNVFSLRATSILNREFCPGFARRPTGSYSLTIYDRWGGQVFNTTNPDECWRGEARGRIVESGVYVYVLQLEISGQLTTLSGDLTFLH